MKKFQIPEFYKSPLIQAVREAHKRHDPKRKSVAPALLRLGTLEFLIPRHFGFCYGVENAVEIAFRAVQENPGRRVFLLSQMIHNPQVNDDLQRYGVRFLQDTQGHPLFNKEELTSDDVVIIPAFGAPLDTLELLEKKGVDVRTYNTTCPFVERVWKKAEQIGKNDVTIIVHGKAQHEETRSTFSRVVQYAPAAVVVLNLEEALRLEPYIMGIKSQKEFEYEFSGRYSEGFDILRHFNRVGVVNQTTMLATETQEIADYFRELMRRKFGTDSLSEHFMDTRDTLCYATHENQESIRALINYSADAAIVAGGYNSSNTSHLVELLEQKFPVFFVSSPDKLHPDFIETYNIHFRIEEKLPIHWNKSKRFILSGGASCPDSLLEQIIHKIFSFYTDVSLPDPHIQIQA